MTVLFFFFSSFYMTALQDSPDSFLVPTTSTPFYCCFSFFFSRLPSSAYQLSFREWTANTLNMTQSIPDKMDWILVAIFFCFFYFKISYKLSFPFYFIKCLTPAIFFFFFHKKIVSLSHNTVIIAKTKPKCTANSNA